MAARTEQEREALRSYLLQAVSYQNDAEPQLLADYLFALFENNDKLTATDLAAELGEFIESDVTALSNSLITGITSRSYLSSNPSTSTLPPSIPSGPTPFPQDPSSASKKRRLSQTDGAGDVEMQDAQKIVKLNDDNGAGMGMGMRMGVGVGIESYDGSGGRGRGGFVGNARGRGRGGMRGPGGRKPCFDYHNKGFCARGMNCPFEHGPDTMYALPGMGPMPGFPPFMMPPFPNGGPAPDGQSSNGDPPTGAAVNPDGMQVDKPEGAEYNPDQPGFVPGQAGPAGGGGDAGMIPFMMPGMGGMPFNFEAMAGMGGFGGMGFGNQGQGQGQGGRGGQARSRGRGGNARRGGGQQNYGSGMPFDNWDGQLSTRPPKDNDTSTLVVAEIPTENLNLESIHNQFKKFGTVTNVAVEFRAKKALVAFSSNRAAHAAWASKDPFFGDRHVKVLWHRPREGQGEAGAKALADSAPLLENLRKIDAQGVDAVQGVGKLPGLDPEVKAQLEEMKERGVKLEKIVAEQKVLMNRLGGAKSPEDKQEIKARLKELIAESNEIKNAKPIDVEKLQAIADAQTKAREEVKAKLIAQREAAAAARKVQTNVGDGVFAMQDLLDQELEQHQLSVKLEGMGKGKDGEEVDEETLALRQKLAELKSQAASMGLNPDASAYSPRGGYRGGRPYRGRPSPYSHSSHAATFAANRSLKLDNRPKSLAVSGPAVLEKEKETLQGVKEWFADLAGEMLREPVVVEGKILVVFNSRQSAETAINKGATIPSISPAVNVSWHSPPAPEVPMGAPAAGEAASSMEGVETAEVKAEGRGEREGDD